MPVQEINGFVNELSNITYYNTKITANDIQRY